MVEKKDMFKEEEDKNYPVSVYLTRDEKAEIERLAEEAGTSRHAFLQYAVLDFAKRFRDNPSIMKTKQTPDKPEL